MNYQELLALSKEEIRAERSRLQAILDAAVANIDLCNRAIAEKLAEFSVGDRVTDAMGVRWEITDIALNKWSTMDAVKYTGRRVKRDGSLWSLRADIIDEPIRSTSNDDNVADGEKRQLPRPEGRSL